MKKTIQFLFAMCMVFAGGNSFAGTNDPTSAPEKPILNNVEVSSTRGIQVLILTVTDDNFKPIAGAIVNAPCTGVSPKATNSSGVAQFTITGTCGCNAQNAYITTSAGCNTHVALTCAGDNSAICPN